MKRYICVHGHFYQPPRENPTLESIELQESAHPYHDWNERITSECYAPNTVARILDDEKRIIRLVNNYSRISFNFGATLLTWMEKHAEEAYQALLDADLESRERFSGHGSALAQVYHHAIMPLCNERDRRTQVRWGARDFESRFGRRPEGMWLAETAVDLASLEELAEEGIQFTVLAPRQARRFRRIGSTKWTDAREGSINPKRAYRLNLPSGRSIALFFYDGPISQGVAFESFLSDGAQFANRLMSAFSRGRRQAELVNIATDGETYGHHHQYGEMALAYALDVIDASDSVDLTNYGEFLERFPPEFEVEVFDESSWSCAHGVERWRSDCGCHTGRGSGWKQAWRGPLRSALDYLRDELAPLFEEQAGRYLKSPWDARDAYVDVIERRDEITLETFLATHAREPLQPHEVNAVLELMELQRNALYMYTSCGWFFDDLAGIETVQVLAYAGRALQLAEKRFRPGLEEGFLSRLEKARSNDPDEGDGRAVFERYVRPGMADLVTVAAHHAIAGLFGEQEEQERIYCFSLRRKNTHDDTRNDTKLCVGRVEVRSEITAETALLSYGFVHFGGHLLNGGIAALETGKKHQEMLKDVTGAFRGGDVRQILGALQTHFGDVSYSFRSLFRDEQRRIAELLLRETGQDVESEYRRIYDELLPLLEFLCDLSIPLPRVFRPAAEIALNSYLREALRTVPPDVDRVLGLLAEARTEGVALDHETLGFELERSLREVARRLSGEPESLEFLDVLETTVDVSLSVPFHVNLWWVQNIFWAMIRATRPRIEEAARTGSAGPSEWLERFTRLAEKLSIRL